jgi:acetoin utilization protein AcuB
MFVGMCMTTELITVRTDTALAECVRLMSEMTIRHLPVMATLEGEERLVGMLSSGDIAKARNATTVSQAMTPDPLTTRVDVPIESVAAIMRECKIGALPVIRGSTLVGLITQSDVFDAFCSVFDLEAHGARIVFDISKGEDVLPFLVSLAASHASRITSFATFSAHERPMCVVHVVGEDLEPMLEEVWRSHHRIESVIRTGPPPA